MRDRAIKACPTGSTPVPLVAGGELISMPAPMQRGDGSLSNPLPAHRTAKQRVLARLERDSIEPGLTD